MNTNLTLLKRLLISVLREHFFGNYLNFVLQKRLGKYSLFPTEVWDRYKELLEQGMSSNEAALKIIQEYGDVYPSYLEKIYMVSCLKSREIDGIFIPITKSTDYSKVGTNNITSTKRETRELSLSQMLQETLDRYMSRIRDKNREAVKKMAHADLTVGKRVSHEEDFPEEYKLWIDELRIRNSYSFDSKKKVEELIKSLHYPKRINIRWCPEFEE